MRSETMSEKGASDKKTHPVQTATKSASLCRSACFRRPFFDFLPYIQCLRKSRFQTENEIFLSIVYMLLYIIHCIIYTVVVYYTLYNIQLSACWLEEVVPSGSDRTARIYEHLRCRWLALRYLRISEFTTPSASHFDPRIHPTIASIRWSRRHFTFHLNHSKMDQFFRGHNLRITRLSSVICPFKAMARYFARCQLRKPPG